MKDIEEILASAKPKEDGCEVLSGLQDRLAIEENTRNTLPLGIQPDFLTADDPISGSMLPYIITLAAAVLVFGLGWYWHKSRPERDAAVTDTAPKVVRHSAKNRFYVLRAEPDKHSLLAQDFEDFTIKFNKVGSELCGFVLTDVQDDGFSLRHNDGRVLRMEIGQWNRESLSMLNKEVVTLKELHRMGQMTDDDLNRLGSIAGYGDLMALRVLKRIAAVPQDPYAKQAKKMLAGANPEALAMLIDLARDRKHQFRQNVFLAIARTGSLQGFIVLREFAGDNSDLCQVFAIQTLAEYGDKEAMPLLEKLGRNSTLPEETRQAARDAFEKLMQMNE
ncbi:HEAT repeat domain-containing protein [Planctomycetota bacterium]